MTPSQLRKINVIIQKQMMDKDQTRLLMSLILTPRTNLTELCKAYYGPRDEKEKNTIQKRYLKKKLQNLMFKLDYWGFPFVIVVTKDEQVNLTVLTEDLMKLKEG